MTKKEWHLKQQRKKDLQDYKQYKEKEKQQKAIKQHKAIIENVFKGKQEISNYKELQTMNNNIWKTQKHVIEKRFTLNTFEVKSEKDIENLLTKFQSLVLQIERFNNSKNKEVWEKISLSHDEFEVLAIWENYNNIVNDENVSTYNKWQAKEVYVKKMIELCNKLSKKYNIE